MRESIQDMYNNIKRILSNDVYFYTLLIVAVGVLSFGLGRLSMVEVKSDQQPRVVLTEQPAAVAASSLSNTQEAQEAPETATTASYVASKKGTKYHLITCPGAKQMSEANKVYFKSETEAKSSGYTRAKNCKF